jgi:outer membrane protein assembly factor BamB
MIQTLLPLLCLFQAAPVDEVLRERRGGVCALVDTGDAALAERVRGAGTWVVHSLEREEGRVRALRALGAAELWDGRQLPYAEHLLNLLVAGTGLAEAEALRVLAPRGTAWIREGGTGAWRKLVKPVPAEFDEWTHWRHGADGNMVSQDRAVHVPSGVRWIAGPAQDAGGRKWYYDHVLVSANGRNYYDYDEAVLARDAFNGTLLWIREIKAPKFKEQGLPVPPNPTPKMKLATRTSKVRPVASGDRLYAVGEGQIMALDGATGKTVLEYGEVLEPRELLLTGGMLVVSEEARVRGFDAASGMKAWEIPLAARRLVAEGDGLFAVTAAHVVGIDRATGKERWRTADEQAELALTCSAHNGYLVLEKSTLRDDPIGCGIKVYSTRTGQLLWVRDYMPDMTHFRESRAYFAQGLLWLPAEKEGLLGLDPKNGSERKRWQTRGKHCATPVATERYFLAPECEFTDLVDGTQSRSRIFKSACRQPFVPANGLLYTFPLQCECFPMLRGNMGLSSGPAPELASAGRLERGRAAAPEALLKPGGPAGDWPMYRHDPHRTGNTPVPLKRETPARAWEAKLVEPPQGPMADEWRANPFIRGPLSPPVAGDGAIFVAAPDLHRVIALDPRTGKELWSYTAGGRLDGPPTIHEGLCLFGAHDGWVYALRTKDGEPVWRLRAAPREARIVAYGQVESPWPVVTSVLVDGGLAYVAAGRHPTADGGVRVLAIRPATGEIVWEKSVDNLDAITRWYGGTLQDSKVKVGVDFEPVDMLVRDGDRVAMSRWRFEPKTGDLSLALNSTTYEGPGGAAMPRGCWDYGIRQTKMVNPRPPAVLLEGKLRTGVLGDAAMIVAGGKLVTVTQKGDLRVGTHFVDLATTPVHDGLIAAYGALYLSTTRGTLICLE